MDETLKQQAKLIRSQINILNVTPLKYDQTSGAYSDKEYTATKFAVYYEFPYRVNGERYWSKQVIIIGHGYLDAADYKGICDTVTALRKYLED